MTKNLRKRRGFILLLIAALTLTMIPTTAFAAPGQQPDNGNKLEYVAVTINGGEETIIDSSTDHQWLTNGTYSDVNVQIVNETTLSISVNTRQNNQQVVQTYTAVLSDGYVFDANSEITYSGINAQEESHDCIIINVTATAVPGGEEPPVVVVDPEGSIQITKTVAEGYTVPAGAAFTVKSAAGIAVANFTYADFANGVYTVTGLIPGSYTVEETGGEIEGAIWNYSVTYADGEAAVVADGGTAMVEVYNGYEEEPPAEPEYTSVTVRKVWVLDDGGEAVSVQVQLYNDGEAEGEPVTLADGNWEYTFDGLLDDGSVYTVSEVAVPEGFTASQEVVDGVIVITNNDIEEEEPPVTPPPVNPPVDPPYIPYYPPYTPPVDVPEVPEVPEVPVDIEEPEVPLADEPDVEIDEEDVPLAEVPKTGDDIMVWALMAILSLAGFAAMRKNRTNEMNN